MYVYVIYLLMILFYGAIVIKAKEHKEEWMLLLMILCFISRCIMYLFQATPIFTVVTICDIQIQMDDIAMIIMMVYSLIHIAPLFRGDKWDKYDLCTLLLIIPIVISVFRGLLAGTVGSSGFWADTRKYITFIAALYGFFFLMHRSESFTRIQKFKYYIDNLMNVVMVYVFVVWALDLLFGYNSLPGQFEGTLSDGGSTFRIIGPLQALMVAFYTLYKMFEDLTEKKGMSIRTLLFVGIVVLLQWRTIVGAFLVGVVILFAFFIGKNHIPYKFMKQMLASMGVVSLFIAFSLLTGDGLSGITGKVVHLFSSFASMVQGTGTFSTRTDVWKMILDSLVGVEVLFGHPFGQVTEIFWKEILWNVSAHNGYVDYIAKMGYVGVLGLACFMIFLLIQSIKKRNCLCVVILLAQCVYWYGYGFSMEQGAVLGLILAALKHSEKSQLKIT